MTNKVKIFTCYHKPGFLIENNILTPLQVGAVQSEIDLGMLKDSCGINISSKNEKFCEVTALYWMWKNYSHLDYLGLFHYRRQLILKNETMFTSNQWGLVNISNAIEGLEKIGLDEENLQKVIGNYDIILPEPWDVRKGGYLNIYQQYEVSPNHLIEHFDLAIKIIRERYPNFVQSMEKSLQSPFGFFTNIFIMKYEILNDYCKWLFPILFEIEKMVDSTNFSVQEKRFIGYLSERLFNIYFNKLIEEEKINVKYGKRSFLTQLN